MPCTKIILYVFSKILLCYYWNHKKGCWFYKVNCWIYKVSHWIYKGDCWTYDLGYWIYVPKSWKVLTWRQAVIHMTSPGARPSFTWHHLVWGHRHEALPIEGLIRLQRHHCAAEAVQHWCWMTVGSQPRAMFVLLALKTHTCWNHYCT